MTRIKDSKFSVAPSALPPRGEKICKTRSTCAQFQIGLSATRFVCNPTGMVTGSTPVDQSSHIQSSLLCSEARCRSLRLPWQGERSGGDSLRVAGDGEELLGGQGGHSQPVVGAAAEASRVPLSSRRRSRTSRAAMRPRPGTGRPLGEGRCGEGWDTHPHCKP